MERRLNLQATNKVLDQQGYELPPDLRSKFQHGKLPVDMVDIREAQHLLGYKSTQTVLAWWGLFPVKSWWRYAILATRAWGRTRDGKRSYKFFLLCLIEASRQTKRWQECFASLRRFFGKLTERKGPSDAPPPPVKPHGGRCECEQCAGTSTSGALALALAMRHRERGLLDTAPE